MNSSARQSGAWGELTATRIVAQVSEMCSRVFALALLLLQNIGARRVMQWWVVRAA
jgi:hypothetical protein